MIDANVQDPMPVVLTEEEIKEEEDAVVAETGKGDEEEDLDVPPEEPVRDEE